MYTYAHTHTRACRYYYQHTYRAMLIRDEGTCHQSLLWTCFVPLGAGPDLLTLIPTLQIQQSAMWLKSSGPVAPAIAAFSVT